MTDPLQNRNLVNNGIIILPSIVPIPLPLIQPRPQETDTFVGGQGVNLPANQNPPLLEGIRSRLNSLAQEERESLLDTLRTQIQNNAPLTPLKLLEYLILTQNTTAATFFANRIRDLNQNQYNNQVNLGITTELRNAILQISNFTDREIQTNLEVYREELRNNGRMENTSLMRYFLLEGNLEAAILAGKIINNTASDLERNIFNCHVFFPHREERELARLLINRDIRGVAPQGPEIQTLAEGIRRRNTELDQIAQRQANQAQQNQPLQNNAPPPAPVNNTPQPPPDSETFQRISSQINRLGPRRGALSDSLDTEMTRGNLNPEQLIQYLILNNNLNLAKSFAKYYEDIQRVNNLQDTPLAQLPSIPFKLLSDIATLDPGQLVGFRDQINRTGNLNDQDWSKYFLLTGNIEAALLATNRLISGANQDPDEIRLLRCYQSFPLPEQRDLANLYIDRTFNRRTLTPEEDRRLEDGLRPVIRREINANNERERRQRLASIQLRLNENQSHLLSHEDLLFSATFERNLETNAPGLGAIIRKFVHHAQNPGNGAPLTPQEQARFTAWRVFSASSDSGRAVRLTTLLRYPHYTLRDNQLPPGISLPAEQGRLTSDQVSDLHSAFVTRVVRRLRVLEGRDPLQSTLPVPPNNPERVFLRNILDQYNTAHEAYWNLRLADMPEGADRTAALRVRWEQALSLIVDPQVARRQYLINENLGESFANYITAPNRYPAYLRNIRQDVENRANIIRRRIAEAEQLRANGNQLSPDEQTRLEEDVRRFNSMLRENIELLETCGRSRVESLENNRRALPNNLQNFYNNFNTSIYGTHLANLLVNSRDIGNSGGVLGAIQANLRTQRPSFNRLYEHFLHNYNNQPRTPEERARAHQRALQVFVMLQQINRFPRSVRRRITGQRDEINIAEIINHITQGTNNQTARFINGLLGQSDPVQAFCDYIANNSRQVLTRNTFERTTASLIELGFTISIERPDPENIRPLITQLYQRFEREAQGTPEEKKQKAEEKIKRILAVLQLVNSLPPEIQRSCYGGSLSIPQALSELINQRSNPSSLDSSFISFIRSINIAGNDWQTNVTNHINSRIVDVIRRQELSSPYYLVSRTMVGTWDDPPDLRDEEAINRIRRNDFGMTHLLQNTLEELRISPQRINNLRGRDFEQILRNAGFRDVPEVNLTVRGIAEEVRNRYQSLGMIYTNIATFNALSPELRRRVANSTNDINSISENTITGLLVNGTLENSPYAFLRNNLRARIEEIINEEETNIDRLRVEHQQRVSRHAAALQALADRIRRRTSESITTTIPNLDNTNQVSINNEHHFVEDINRTSRLVRESEQRLQQAQGRLPNLRTALVVNHIANLQDVGNQAEADRLLLEQLNTHGEGLRYISPRLWEMASQSAGRLIRTGQLPESFRNLYGERRNFNTAISLLHSIPGNTAQNTVAIQSGAINALISNPNLLSALQAQNAILGECQGIMPILNAVNGGRGTDPDNPNATPRAGYIWPEGRRQLTDAASRINGILFRAEAKLPSLVQQRNQLINLRANIRGTNESLEDSLDRTIEVYNNAIGFITNPNIREFTNRVNNTQDATWATWMREHALSTVTGIIGTALAIALVPVTGGTSLGYVIANVLIVTAAATVGGAIGSEFGREVNHRLGNSTEGSPWAHTGERVYTPDLNTGIEGTYHATTAGELAARYGRQLGEDYLFTLASMGAGQIAGRPLARLIRTASGRQAVSTVANVQRLVQQQPYNSPIRNFVRNFSKEIFSLSSVSTSTSSLHQVLDQTFGERAAYLALFLDVTVRTALHGRGGPLDLNGLGIRHDPNSRTRPLTYNANNAIHPEFRNVLIPALRDAGLRVEFGPNRELMMWQPGRRPIIIHPESSSPTTGRRFPLSSVRPTTNGYQDPSTQTENNTPQMFPSIPRRTQTSTNEPSRPVPPRTTQTPERTIPRNNRAFQYANRDGRRVVVEVDPSLPTSHPAHAEVRVNPDGTRVTYLRVQDRNILNNTLTIAHEIRHANRRQGLIDPIVRDSQGNITRRMTEPEYLALRALEEYQVRAARGPGEAPNGPDVAHTREIQRLIRNRDFQGAIRYAEANGLRSYMSGFRTQYQRNVNRNPQTQPLIQTGRSSTETIRLTREQVDFMSQGNASLAQIDRLIQTTEQQRAAAPPRERMALIRRIGELQELKRNIETRLEELCNLRDLTSAQQARRVDIVNEFLRNVEAGDLSLESARGLSQRLRDFHCETIADHFIQNSSPNLGLNAHREQILEFLRGVDNTHPTTAPDPGLNIARDFFNHFNFLTRDSRISPEVRQDLLIALRGERGSGGFISQPRSSSLTLRGAAYELGATRSLLEGGWRIERFALDIPGGEIDIIARHPDGRTFYFEAKATQSALIDKFNSHPEQVVRLIEYALSRTPPGIPAFHVGGELITIRVDPLVTTPSLSGTTLTVPPNYAANPRAFSTQLATIFQGRT